MIPEIEIMRARDIAAMNEKLEVVWLTVIGIMVAFIVVSALIRLRSRRQANQASNAMFRTELSRHIAEN